MSDKSNKYIDDSLDFITIKEKPKKGLDPIPNGDVLLVPLNLIPTPVSGKVISNSQNIPSDEKNYTSDITYNSNLLCDDNMLKGDIYSIKGLDPIPNGDVLLVPLNLIPTPIIEIKPTEPKSLLSLIDKPKNLDSSEKFAKPDGDSSDIEHKMEVRISGMNKAGKYKSLELFAGEGHITKEYKKHFENLICVEKDESKIPDLQKLVGKENVYNIDNAKFLEGEDFKKHMDFSLVDFDAYGSPGKLIQVFADKIKGRDKGFVLSLTDGGLMNMNRGGKVNPYEWWLHKPDEMIKPSEDAPELIEKFDELVDGFINKIAKKLGMEATKIDSVLRPHKIYYASYKFS